MAKEIILANAPTGFPVTEMGRADSTFELRQVDLPELKNNQLLLKTIFISNDPGETFQDFSRVVTAGFVLLIFARLVPSRLFSARLRSMKSRSKNGSKSRLESL
ncbi:hypothetical protein F5878DRAFT_626345, partial [Lentinula raphanica]